VSGRSFTVYREVEVDVDLDLDELAEGLEPADVAHLISKCGMPAHGVVCPMGLGDGDESRISRIVDEAERAVRRIPHIPRELADMFWHVHGRALA